jgi:acyl-CoA dehydrogenase family protein 9
MEKSKKHTGILENLYLGAFEKNKFTSFTRLVLEPEAQKIIEQYQELIKDYPPDKLEEAGELPEALWAGLKKIGIFGLNIPKEYGGVGLPVSQYLKVLENMARHDMALAIIPTAHLSIGLKGIILFGNEAQKKKYLTKASSGAMLFAYALTEPNVGSDAQHIETKAELSADGKQYILNGSKTYITNGGYAGGLTVFAQLDPEKPGFMGAFIVETGWDGVTIGKPMPKMGLAISSTTSITFKDVKVPVENLLGEPGDGFKIAMTILNYGRLGLGAASVGVLKQAVEDMVKRASTRKQFGVPIKQFELIQEKIVKAQVHGFAAEAMTHFAAHLLKDDPTANVAMESSHTKLYGTNKAWDCLYDAMQTAGGAGYIATMPYEKRMRDFRVTTIFEGTTEIHAIYPPLHLLRILGKEIKKIGKSKISQFFFVLTGIMKRPAIPLRFDNPVMQDALHFIKKAVRLIRGHLFKGLVRYGLKVADKEFYLRRITRLSLAVYGLISMLAAIRAGQEQGMDVSSELKLLGYFLEEAKESYTTNSQIKGGRKEALHPKIFQDIDAFREE